MPNQRCNPKRGNDLRGTGAVSVIANSAAGQIRSEREQRDFERSVCLSAVRCCCCCATCESLFPRGQGCTPQRHTPTHTFAAAAAAAQARHSRFTFVPLSLSNSHIPPLHLVTLPSVFPLLNKRSFVHAELNAAVETHYHLVVIDSLHPAVDSQQPI